MRRPPSFQPPSFRQSAVACHCLSLVIFVGLAMVAYSQQPTDWIELFDGQSLDGWTQRGGAAKYEVTDGTIVGTSVPNTANSFLCTEREYSDFELAVEFWVDDELNSGVQVRSASRQDYKNGRVHGYQVEIDPSQRSWSAGIYDEARDGWLADLSENETARAAFHHNRWNQLRIRAQGKRIQTWINGVAAVDFSEAAVPAGFIALQVHGVGDRQDRLQVRWRNIRLIDLAEKMESDVRP